jgi:hypothetical protein
VDFPKFQPHSWSKEFPKVTFRALWNSLQDQAEYERTWHIQFQERHKKHFRKGVRHHLSDLDRLITFFWDLKRNFQERDQKNFQRLCDALRVVGFSEEDMDSIFQAGAYPSPSPGCPPWPGRRVRCLRAWCIWEIFPWRKEMKVLQPMPLVQPEIRYN